MRRENIVGRQRINQSAGCPVTRLDRKASGSPRLYRHEYGVGCGHGG